MSTTPVSLVLSKQWRVALPVVLRRTIVLLRQNWTERVYLKSNVDFKGYWFMSCLIREERCHRLYKGHRFFRFCPNGQIGWGCWWHNAQCITPFIFSTGSDLCRRFSPGTNIKLTLLTLDSTISSKLFSLEVYTSHILVLLVPVMSVMVINGPQLLKRGIGVARKNLRCLVE